MSILYELFYFSRKTLEQEMEMRAQADLKRIEAETVARAKIERENQDLYLEQIRLKAKETRNTAMEGIRTAGSVLGAGAEAFLRDWDKVNKYIFKLLRYFLGFFRGSLGVPWGFHGRNLYSLIGSWTWCRSILK